MEIDEFPPPKPCPNGNKNVYEMKFTYNLKLLSRIHYSEVEKILIGCLFAISSRIKVFSPSNSGIINIYSVCRYAEENSELKRK